MMRPAVASSLCNRARYIRSHSLRCSFLSTSSACPQEDANEQLDYLFRLESARLSFPGDSFRTPPLDLNVLPSSTGGHAVLGRNGSNKTLLANTLADGSHFANTPLDAHVVDGSISRSEKWSPRSVSRVSFESHESLLNQGGSVYNALTPLGGQLSKACQFLVVRFGLFPFLKREVHTLSTGEIRKVLLVRALSTRPDLLILDGAFDGLDVASRASLSELVSKTLQGFRPDILVTGVNAKDTAHTQVLLITQRPEEIVDEITTVSFLTDNDLITENRNGRDGDDLLLTALGRNEKRHVDQLSIWEQCDASLPSTNEIVSLWHGRQLEQNSVLVQAEDLLVRSGDATLLDKLDWVVQREERWLVAGGNGAGKSTLSRLLAREEERRQRVASGMLQVSTESSVGWVSTESHMKQAQSTRMARDILSNEGNVSQDVVTAITTWLDLDSSLLSKPFCRLSQGEQKIVLIAAALAQRPSLLILDEPLQGLDLVNRRRVLGLVEQVCRSTDMSLVYITHHLEELLPSVTHVLHLKDGKAAYKGSREQYDPDVL